ncbi:di-trans,poly-cis-decaprenylcistransferase [Candidatus Woesearchaeota archaeon]|nr:di-trans,poly-cis-decaprenylcistransferase [Candidatus Woesearchaeota archaeon]
MEEPGIPKHIAIILDGNRRYAERKKLSKMRGHERGFEKIKDLLKWCVELGVKEVTLYCFSTENFKRDKEEVSYLFDLFRKRISGFKNDKAIHDNKVRVSVIGRIEMFPEDLQRSMGDIMERTKDYDDYRLNLALAYGGRAEIVDAVKKIISLGVKDVDEKAIIDNLYLSDDVDLLIRPGGEHRLSNFLLFQNAYSELVFTDKLWPEFTKQDFIGCIDEYKRRERRFGG